MWCFPSKKLEERPNLKEPGEEEEEEEEED